MSPSLVCRLRVGLVLTLVSGLQIWGQQQSARLQGKVVDDSGAVVPGATVSIAANADVHTTTSAPDGSYLFDGVKPATYQVTANAPGLVGRQEVALSAGKTVTQDVIVMPELLKQEITVRQTTTRLSTDPANNADALVLRGETLQALPDDPDELAADLQALAGPSAGLSGSQFFIDGFTGGRFPPKESIREIRINQTPFSAEYDRPGFGRIELFSKPGSDRYRATGLFSFSDGAFNSRNPYAMNKAPFHAKRYGANLSGPVNKKGSFFLDGERRDIDDNAIINASTLDPSLNIIRVMQAVSTPQQRTNLSPRLDYQITTRNTLMARYRFTNIEQARAGVGGFNLLSRAYGSSFETHTMQLTETAVVTARMVNETRLQYMHIRRSERGDNSVPAINVLEAFVGGGAQIGRSSASERHWELQNYTSLLRNSHTVKAGARVRTISLHDISPQNFGGTFIFAGGFAPQLDADNHLVLDDTGNPIEVRIDSLERYRRTVLFNNLNLTPGEVRTLGGGAAQFLIAAGNPAASVNRLDVGLFAQDDWRIRPSFTLSLGLRYEFQAHIHDWRDLGPRIGFAWAPRQKASGRTKTVIRGGTGVFYDRFSEIDALQAQRYNGINQRQYIVLHPNFYPIVPPIETLNTGKPAKIIRQIDGQLRAPYLIQSALGIERQLPFRTSFSATFTRSRGVHILRTRNINAPLPAAFLSRDSRSGLRPYGNAGNIYLYESTGILNQNQFMIRMNNRLSRKFTLFAGYTLNQANSDTDGIGTFPSNQYDLSREYGRSAIDVRHRFFSGGSFVGPGALQFNPFIIARSGAPFNITTGRDQNGDTVFTHRPAFATDPTKPGAMLTPYGVFNTRPGPKDTLIPRNYAEGPGHLTVNLRVSRTFAFGGARLASGARRGDPVNNQRHSVTFSVAARNLFNHTNPGPPVGNLSSSFFGTSTGLSRGVHSDHAPANNRYIELQARLMF